MNITNLLNNKSSIEDITMVLNLFNINYKFNPETSAFYANFEILTEEDTLRFRDILPDEIEVKY